MSKATTRIPVPPHPNKWMEGLPQVLINKFKAGGYTEEGFFRQLDGLDLPSPTLTKLGVRQMGIIRTWRAKYYPNKPDTANGIVKVTKFRTPDGSLHDTDTAAKAHIASENFKLDLAGMFGLSGIDGDSDALGDAILAHYNVTLKARA